MVDDEKCPVHIKFRKIAPDEDVKLIRSRLGIRPIELMYGLNLLPAEMAKQYTNPPYVWPKHTMKGSPYWLLFHFFSPEVSDYSHSVYQHGAHEANWSLRYKALGCYKFVSCTPYPNFFLNSFFPKDTISDVSFPQPAKAPSERKDLSPEKRPLPESLKLVFTTFQVKHYTLNVSIISAIKTDMTVKASGLIDSFNSIRCFDWKKLSQVFVNFLKLI
ncbi:hypothetical protein Ciccas_005242 [Cichlidogyrus casuarinus]|uniref:Uncharacterized protein n=1 Tax=Cichlidogyrus casuarinus TaxID=1844966 RepID=A0ABD2Q985_9PLAT